MKQFSKGRRPDQGEGEGEHEKLGSMNRLYAVESNFTLTGAMADHRLRMKSGDIRGFATDLAGALGAMPALNVVNNGGEKRAKFLAALVKDLKAHQGKALVVAGAATERGNACRGGCHQPGAQRAGDLHEDRRLPAAGRRPEGNSAADIAKGAVDTLVILGGNPAYTAPGDLALAAQIKGRRQPPSISASTRTKPRWSPSGCCRKPYYLESWSDGRAPDGTVTIIQPMIEPLYGGKYRRRSGDARLRA